MKNVIILCTLFFQVLFFSVCGIIGYTYEGFESTPIYRTLIMIMGALSLFFTISNVKTRTTSYFFYLFLLPLIVYLIYLVEVSLHYEISNLTSSRLIVMLGFIYPSLSVAIYMAYYGINQFAKWIQIAMIIITIASLLSVRDTLVGQLLHEGGANYQELAYYSAFAFCINLCFIIYGEKLEVFPFFKTKVYKIASYILLIIQLIGCLITGGRGGFVLLTTCSVYMLLRAHMGKNLLRVVLLSTVIGLLFTIIMNDSSLFSILGESTQRTFSYITSEGIDMSETSQRDVVYTDAIRYIENHGYMGGGIFKSYYDIRRYPHNIFLEFLEQGGVIYLVFWIIIFIKALIKTHLIIKIDDEYLLLPFIFYPMVQLQFSNSYLLNGYFWFVIAYVFTRSIILNKIIIRKYAE